MVENFNYSVEAVNDFSPRIPEYNLKNPADRERVLKEVIDIVTSGENIYKIKKRIVDFIGTVFNCDRCFIRIYDSSIDNFQVINTEYLSSGNIKSIKNFTFPKDLSCIVNTTCKCGNSFYLPDVELLSKNFSSETSKLKEIFENLQVKSNYCCPILKGNKLLGAFAIHYVKEKVYLSEEEFDLIKSIAKQVMTIIHKETISQDLAYKYKSESILRSISEIILYEDDPDKALKSTINLIADSFDVEIVSIVHVPWKNARSVVYKSTFRTGNNTYTPIKLNYEDKLREFWKKRIIDEGDCLAVNNIEKSNLPEFLKENYRKLNSRSIIAAGIKKGDDKWGGISLQQTSRYRDWTKEEIELLKIIADTIYIVIKQASYYTTFKKQAERENLFKNIMTAIRETLEINELKKRVVSEIGRTFQADRCVLYQFDSSREKFLPIDSCSEYLSSQDLASLTKLDTDKYDFSCFRNILVKENEIIAPDWEEYFNNMEAVDITTRKLVGELKIKSNYAFPFTYADKLLGCICLTYDSQHKEFSCDDLESFRTLMNQVGVALYHSQMYSTTKKHAEREYLQRKIISTIRQNMDLNIIKKTLVTELGKALSIDRVVFMEYDERAGKFLPVDEHSEYRLSEDVLSMVDFNVEGLIYFDSVFKQGQEVITYDTDNLIMKNNLQNTSAEEYIKKYKVKSGLGIPIVHGENVLGRLITHFTQNTITLNEGDIEFIRTLSNQAGIAIYQSKLYAKAKQAAEREILLRNIIESIRNSLNIHEIKLNIVNGVGKAFNADRCFIRIFDSNTDSYLPVDKYSEYLSSNNIKSVLKFQVSPLINQTVQSLHIQNISLIIPDCNSMDSYNYSLKKHFEFYGVKSNYGVPILYGNKLLGNFVIHYTEKAVELSNEEIELLKTVANQAGVAFKQAELFSRTKKQAKKESLLRQITQLVMNSLDIEKIKNSITRELGKALNADRCIITEFDSKGHIIPFVYEYLSSPEIKTMIGVNPEIQAPDFVDITKSGQIVQFKNFDELKENSVIKDESFFEFWGNLGLKSGFSIPITYSDKVIGVLILHYVIKEHEFTNEELNFIKDLINQVGVAIAHARLYETEKRHVKIHNAEIKIISAIKGSMNIQECLYVICSEIADLLDAKQVIIDNYSEKAKIIKTIKAFNNDKSDYSDFNDDLKEYLFENLFKQNTYAPVNRVLINDLKLIQAYKEKYSALLLVPIKSGAEKFGAVTIFDNKPRNWAEEEIALLEKLSDYISIAIKNANLYTQAQFIANVSHELKTPIANITGYAEAIMYNDPDKSEITAKFIDTIKRNADRLDNILNNLLNISTIQRSAESEKHVYTDYSLAKLIEDSITHCSRLSDSKNITIVFNKDNNISLRVNIQLIEQALINLINNAIKYSDDNTSINIELIRNSKEVQIKITDEGIGIQEQDLINIFEPFYRVEKSRNRETGGTGLGLPIVKAIIEAHNGSVSVKSEFGKGSTFTIHLPLNK